MTILTWHDQYLIGNPTIDAEHKVLFALVNEFHTSWSENRDRAAVASILNRLIQYGQRHFQDEEAIMEQVQYPLLEAHRKIHEKLVDDIFKLNQELAEQNQRLAHDLGKFLKHWLVDHIVHCDYDFREFLNRELHKNPAP